ncbi:hypothetical protein MG293_012477 [Ovis ammon polii]|uniref:Uncharacterized protein n=1 Tax=Ovis ammon polii TaxID=230172 RepID=A0AAD4U441_OVIAM|nr:hypothetical protein MG293_012477 [Ovis ammon polii]
MFLLFEEKNQTEKEKDKRQTPQSSQCPVTSPLTVQSTCLYLYLHFQGAQVFSKPQFYFKSATQFPHYPTTIWHWMEESLCIQGDKNVGSIKLNEHANLQKRGKTGNDSTIYESKMISVNQCQ